MRISYSFGRLKVKDVSPLLLCIPHCTVHLDSSLQVWRHKFTLSGDDAGQGAEILLISVPSFMRRSNCSMVRISLLGFSRLPMLHALKAELTRTIRCPAIFFPCDIISIFFDVYMI